MPTSRMFRDGDPVRASRCEKNDRKRSAARHSVEKARNAGLCGESGTETADHQDQREDLEHPLASDNTADIEERSLDAGEVSIVRPNELGEVNLQSSEYPCEHADYNCSEHYISSGIIALLRRALSRRRTLRTSEPLPRSPSISWASEMSPGCRTDVSR